MGLHIKRTMNLFICNTPFHLYFSLKIIQEFNIKNINLVFFGDKLNKKNAYYFKKTLNFTNRSIWLNCDQKTIYFKREISSHLERLNYENVYLASIDSIYSQLILSKIKYNNLYTFDDGTANINKKSSYYIDKRSLLKKIIYFLIGNRYEMNKIKKLSKSHFSIYHQENIIKTVYYLDIYQYNKKLVNNYSCNLILGSVYSEILNDIAIKDLLFSNIMMVINKFDGDIIYLPHPRDTKVIDSLAEYYLDTHLIFEELISTLAEKYSKINVFSFASSSIINFNSLNSYIFTGSIFNERYTTNVNALFPNKKTHINIDI